VKNHTLALTGGPQSVNSGPEAVGSLGHQHEVLALHLGHTLARRLRENPFQNPARVVHPGNVHRVFLRLSPGGTLFSTWALEVFVLVGLPPINPDTSPGAPGEVRLCAFDATGTDGEPVHLAVNLGGPLGLLSAVW
jgi:hypothetical protein